MILTTKTFQAACKTILYAIESKNATIYNETLELIANGETLNLNVTNREYYVQVRFGLEEPTVFAAAVNAKLFLNLIAKLTTEKIEIIKDGNAIKIKANGEYKLPVIFNNDKMLELPTISMNNITCTMSINSDVLHSIATYNSKELTRGQAERDIQTKYYVDEIGAITFTTGACVNTFALEKPIKMLLDDKIVKLFRLFKTDEKIEFSLANDAVTDDLIQSKAKFETPNVMIISKLPDSNLVTSCPASRIRALAEKTYNYTTVVKRDLLLAAIQRIKLFAPEGQKLTKTKMVFTPQYITLFDVAEDNQESVKVENECSNLSEFAVKVNLDTLCSMVEGSEEDYITVCFGDPSAVVVKKANITDIMKVYSV